MAPTPKNDIPFNPPRRYTKRCPSDGNRYRRDAGTSSSTSSSYSGGAAKNRSARTGSTSTGVTTSGSSRGSRRSQHSRRSVTPEPENVTTLREVHYVDAIQSARIQQHPPFETRARSANLLYIENSKKAVAEAFLERGNPFPYEALPITHEDAGPLATGCAYSENDVPKKKALPPGQTERSALGANAYGAEGQVGYESVCVLEPYRDFFALKNNAENYEFQTGLRSVPPTPLPPGVLPKQDVPAYAPAAAPQYQVQAGGQPAITAGASLDSGRQSRFQNVANYGAGRA